MSLPNRIASIVLGLAACGPAAAERSDAQGEWPVYGRDAGGTRYSPLNQIERGNVGSLTVAWTYRTREAEPEFAARGDPTLEVTPLMVDGTLFLSTPLGRVIALDPVTGTERWVFDPRIDRRIGYGDFTNRGVAAWLDSGCARHRVSAPDSSWRRSTAG
jgi:quinoprotein glucose dehydrogenase